MPDVLDHSLSRLALRRRLQRGLDGLLPAMAIGAAAAATAVMVVRLGVPSLAWTVWPLAAAGVLAPVVALPRALRTQDRTADLAGHLDLQLGVNGVAMALAAVPADGRDGGWQARLRRPLEEWQPPALQWHGGGRVLAALAILGLALLLPQAEARRATKSPTAGLFAGAAERLHGLTDAQLLPPEQADEFAKRLQELQANAERTGMDQATWEGLARLEQDLQAANQQAGRRLAEALAQAELAAKTPEAPSTPAVTAEMAAAMSQQMAELAAQAPGLVPQLAADADAQAMQQALAQAAAQGRLSPEQLAALQKLGLKPAPNLDGKPLTEEQLRQLADKLAKGLAQNCDKLGVCDGCDGDQFALLLAEARGRPGRGGVGRGPGHTNHPQLETERFPVGSIEGLPPGARLNPDGSVTLAEQVREPEVDAEAAEAGRRAAAQQFDPTAADARRASTAPRHRAAVSRYFAGE